MMRLAFGGKFGKPGSVVAAASARLPSRPPSAARPMPLAAVIAGPGTGKTQILAARIGKILLETDALPENILCLTYTDAGTIAMRKRLQQFIGADAYKVNIYTFHAFCNDVIQDNLNLFEKNSLDAVSELESIEMFKQLIDAFPKNHPLKRYRGDVYYEINNLRSLFSSMKREGWTADFINQRIDDYINDLPNRDEYVAKRAVKEFKKGDVRTDKIEEEKEKMEKLRAAVNEFDNFQQLMRKRNRYDFAKGAYDAALKYSKERHQFGQPISNFQGISFKLADMATEIEASELLLHKSAYLKQNHKPVTTAGAMAKMYASEVCVKVAGEAVQIHGGYGFTKDYPVEKFYRDSKLCTIGEGTTVIQKLVISRNLLKD